ncbi:LCP family protein [Streptomyces sp. MAR25Y5]|uniref:LCP family protein n=1 Tax=Streptomyces sp. H-KF8 TaxID=1727216 RepID=UPI00099F9613|nr:MULTISPECIES: LCP family protein [unclassified Streptomyces]MCP3768955.1 LCP family protein [Streptomyces sp. MAR25Y5]
MSLLPASSRSPRPRTTPQRRPQPPREGGPRPLARRWPRWGPRAVTTLSVLVLAAAGIGHAVVSSLDAGIDRVDPFRDMKNRPEAGHGMNVLLVGTDGREKVGAQARRKYRLGGAPCNCTDTIMIVHLSEDRERASVVSLPRDSYAMTPPHTDQVSGEEHEGHPVKLNAAYAEGGPQLTVRTVEKMTRVKIDHYLELDFTSFMKTVDAVGGVELCTTEPLKDSHTGLDLPAGRHALGGGEALQYVRARYVDGAADLGRMKRQQHFMAALLDRATSSGILLNPLKFRDVTRAVLGSVRADEGFGTGELLALGRALRNFSPSSSEFTTVPLGEEGHMVEGIGATLKWDPAKAEKIFAALREDEPLSTRPSPGAARRVPVDPRRIRVQVENGTQTEGLGRRVDAALAATGFRTTRAPVNAADRSVRRTVVAYDPRWDRSAKSLAAALPGSELRAVRGQGATLRVIAGTDFEKVREVRAEDPGKDGSGVVRGDEVGCS